jgi:hypothetical protein
MGVVASVPAKQRPLASWTSVAGLLKQTYHGRHRHEYQTKQKRTTTETTNANQKQQKQNIKKKTFLLQGVTGDSRSHVTPSRMNVDVM